jgi:hypothetical protein
MELFYPLFLSWNVRKMGMLNNRNRKIPLLRSIHLVATIFTLTIIFTSTTTLVSASTTGNNTTATTTSVGGEQEAVNTTTATNNVSNAVLGSLFLTGEDRLTSFNPINETYTEVSYVGNRTILPPDAATTATINATETGNLTLNLQPNGITLVEGQSLLVAEGGNNNGGTEQEYATAVLVDLNGVRPDDPRSSTGVVFFSTNSTGQLAFLDNMIAIYQVKASPEGTAIRMWEWKGADLPFETSGAAPTMGNQTTTITSVD